MYIYIICISILYTISMCISINLICILYRILYIHICKSAKLRSARIWFKMNMIWFEHIYIYICYERTWRDMILYGHDQKGYDLSIGIYGLCMYPGTFSARIRIQRVQDVIWPYVYICVYNVSIIYIYTIIYTCVQCSAMIWYTMIWYDMIWYDRKKYET